MNQSILLNNIKAVNSKKTRPRIIKDNMGMNKTEARYAGYLAGLQRNGEIISYGFEQIRLKLANRTTYTPDYFVVKRNVMAFHEVKGMRLSTGMAKLKIAAQAFPQFEFWLVESVKGDGWKYTCYSYGDLET